MGTKSTPKVTQNVTQSRSRIWATIIYPESAPENFRDLITDSGIPCYLSPLHCDDVNETTGEKNKLHHHLIAKYDTMKSPDQFKEFANTIGGVGAERVHSFRAAARYLCHLDNPDKARYDASNVLAFNGIGDYATAVMSSEEVECEIDQVVREILLFCRENVPLIRNNFSRLVDYAMDNNPEWFRHLRRDCAYIVEKKLKSAAYDAKETANTEKAFVMRDGCLINLRTGEVVRKFRPGTLERVDPDQEGGTDDDLPSDDD